MPQNHLEAIPVIYVTMEQYVCLICLAESVRFSTWEELDRIAWVLREGGSLVVIDQDHPWQEAEDDVAWSSEGRAGRPTWGETMRRIGRRFLQ